MASENGATPEQPEQPEQLSLDGGSVVDPFAAEAAPGGHVGPPAGLTIEDMFWKFHRANPQVYAELVKLARRGRRAGAKRLGIGNLFEVLRWRHTLRTGGDDFKLNNNYRSYYSRLIMHREGDLAGVFELRELHAPRSSGQPYL